MACADLRAKGVVNRARERASATIHKDFPCWHYRCFQKGVHATFFQKVLICAFAGFLAASLVEWAKVFVEGADDALNKGYKHRAVLDTTK
jgi:hypothetical protein